MKKIYPYLKDENFLNYLNTLPNKEQIVKITLLDWAENPLQEVQGKVTDGSLNLDGSSAMRRTCNLSVFIKEEELDFTGVNQMIALNKKVFLEQGIINTTSYYQEEKIIWFPLGLYIITSATINHNLSGSTASLQLKDKMCLLNGEVGGLLPASVTFSEVDTIDEKGEWVTIQPTIFQIIQELVNHFGGEQLGNIIINDVDTRIKQVMKWTGSKPLYIEDKVNNNRSRKISLIPFDGAKAYQSGRDVGFIFTDFVYPGELVGNTGDTICTILDKIKNTLGNYEYFYDVYGTFIFQEIKNYLNIRQSTNDITKLKKENYQVDITKGKAAFVFSDNNLITSFSNAPQFNMIKNDFIVWGKRKGIDGQEYPIRYHLAIDKKPQTGNTYEGIDFTEDAYGLKQAVKVSTGGKTIKTKDWRSDLYLAGVCSEKIGVNSNNYYTELANEWLKLYDLEKGDFLEETKLMPDNLDYFLDFIDTESEVGKFNISNIGCRQKVVVDDKINCLFEPEIPDIIMIEINGKNQQALREECDLKQQDYSQINSNIYSLLETGGTLNSAFVMIKDLLYQYTSYNESITLQALPIYYLEPNIRITVNDIRSGIHGDYMIKSMSLPLSVRGTMSISATRVLDKI